MGLPTPGRTQDQTSTPSAESPEGKAEENSAERPAPTKIVVTFLPKVEDYYSIEARSKHMQGLAMVTMCISDTGTIDSVKIEKSSGYDLLDQDALNVARAYKFKPPTQAGKPVPVCTHLPVRFGLPH
jgi:protein TonB